MKNVYDLRPRPVVRAKIKPTEVRDYVIKLVILDQEACFYDVYLFPLTGWLISYKSFNCAWLKYNSTSYIVQHLHEPSFVMERYTETPTYLWPTYSKR